MTTRASFARAWRVGVHDLALRLHQLGSAAAAGDHVDAAGDGDGDDVAGAVGGNGAGGGRNGAAGGGGAGSAAAAAAAAARRLDAALFDLNVRLGVLLFTDYAVEVRNALDCGVMRDDMRGALVM